MKIYIVIALVVLALTGALGYSLHLNLEARSALATAESERDEATDKAATTQALLDDQLAANARLQKEVERIERNRQATEQALRDERNRREALEDTDDEYRAWANTRLPDAVIRMLNDRHPPADQATPLPGRGQPGAAGGETERGDSERERPPAEPAG